MWTKEERSKKDYPLPQLLNPKSIKLVREGSVLGIKDSVKFRWLIRPVLNWKLDQLNGSIPSARWNTTSVHRHTGPSCLFSLNCSRLSWFPLKRCSRKKEGKGDHHRLIDRLMVEARKDERKKGSLNFIYKSTIKAKILMMITVMIMEWLPYSIHAMIWKKNKGWHADKRFYFIQFFFFARKKTRNSKSIFLLRSFIHFFIFFQFWFEILYFLTKIGRWKQFSITIMQNMLIDGWMSKWSGVE